MEVKCTPAPSNKKEYITDIGKILVSEYGKKKYYKPEEIEKASKKSKYYESGGIDWACWAMCVFSSHSDFDTYHQLTGEMCDYVGMKTEMLSELVSSSSVDWLSIPDLDIDTSWFNLGDVFDGIGEFISGIFD